MIKRVVHTLERGSIDIKPMLSFLKSIAGFVLVLVFLKGTVVEAFRIPSKSMVPTLIEHDHLLVNKLSYGLRMPWVDKTVLQYSEPERGDIVVFTRPDNSLTYDIDESETNIIKRVIGLPGDTVEVKGTSVYINAKLLENDRNYSRYFEGGVVDFGPVEVPKGHVFLLGDNRDQSHDSRKWTDSPFLSIARIKGRAFIIYWNTHSLRSRAFKVLS